MHRTARNVLHLAIGIGWAAAVAAGAARLWQYDGAPGDAARAPLQWPAETRLSHNRNLPTLVLALHPRCPCSRATVGELAKLMTDCRERLDAIVLVERPAGMPEGWERTGLWADAAEIPGVTVVADEEGNEARRFGAATSGQTLLYAADGRLLFAGGITESRGHSGDNAGRSAIATLVLGAAVAPNSPAQTPVYGCPLFDLPPSSQDQNCLRKGSTPCRK